MKKIRTAILLTVALSLLVGCASMLEREYVSATTHSAVLQTTEESDALRVESYQELVNALLYLVLQGEEGGTLRLYNYDGDTAYSDLTAACLEMTEEVPIGAYAVSYIQFDLTTIVSYLEADISITYRRTEAQMASIQSAVGTSAIRNQFVLALEQFQEEIVLQLDYFDGDEAELRELIQRAYYETPSSALGMPTVQVQFYPRTGTQRIAEVTLDYPHDGVLLRILQSSAEDTALLLLADSWDLTGEELLMELCNLVVEQGGLQSEGNTAYYALVRGGATSEGLALALSLLCQERGMNCSVVQGTLEGQAHFWNVIITPWGYRHVDLSTWGQEDWTEEDRDAIFFSDLAAVESNYQWNRNWVPLCGEQPVEETGY